MQIVSVPGRLVRDPVTLRVVGSEPITIDPTDFYWSRLIEDGDVADASLVTAPAADAAPAIVDPAADPAPAEVEAPAAAQAASQSGEEPSA